MKAGSTQGGGASALGRLVARAGRPAVRSREDFGRSHVVELDGPDTVSPSGAIEPARRVPTPRAQRVESSLPPRRATPTEVAAQLVLEPPVAAGPAPIQRLEREQQDARPEATLASPGIRAERRDPAPPRTGVEPAAAEDGPLPDTPPTWTLVEPALQPAGNVSVRELEPPGWQALAEAEKDDAILRAEDERPRGVVAPARALEPEASRPIMSLSAPPLPVGDAARGDLNPATPAALGPPQVLIDRIEVITPAAPRPAPDPFLSLAARRVGASRHGGTT